MKLSWIPIIFLGTGLAIWPFDSDESTSLSSGSNGGSSTSTTADQGVVGGIVSFFGGGDSTPSGSVVVSANSTLPVTVTTHASSSSIENPYQPIQTSCPTSEIVRQADGLCSEEKEYIELRHDITNKNLIDFLTKRAKLSDFDAESFIKNYSPVHNITIGLAFSGGGYRAMLTGAGQISGLDDRIDDANSKGLGGLLQSSTYLVGLSGGNWLVGTLVLNDWISVGDIYSGDAEIWSLEHNIFVPDGLNVFKTVGYYNSIQDAVLAKDDAGFNTSITDIWGLALMNQFLPGDRIGMNLTWSGIRDLKNFKNHEMPYPIVVADGRTPFTFILNENSTVFEISPYELGSWDPSLEYFADTRYIGSTMYNGDNATDECVVNFDNAGFVMGTSSSLFNQIIIRAATSNLPDVVKSILENILGGLSYDNDDIAAYSPNPFFHAEHAGNKSIVDNSTLFLVDGGEDAQNVPFYPLIQNSRKVDVIFGFDNSADTEQNWPNGTSIVHTYLRQFSNQGKGTPFPYVPDIDTFLSDEMNQRPYFFGCDAKNLTYLMDFHNNSNINSTDVPLVVYIPNSYYSKESNTSTFKMTYDPDEKYDLFQNGFEIATRGNLSTDADWARCVGCAIIRRSQERLQIEQSDECKQCFDEYCWKGSSEDAAYDYQFNAFLESAGFSSAEAQQTSSKLASSSKSESKHGGAGTTKRNLVASFLNILVLLLV